LRQTIDDVQIIGSKKSLVLKIYVDALYAIHPDIKGQTGGLSTLGYGVVHHKSGKQKLNSKSSTKSELVGGSDYIPYTIWIKRFMKEQGYNVDEMIFCQDNESVIKMESNGRLSAGNKS